MLMFTLRVHKIVDIQILQWLRVSCQLNCMCGRDLEITICSKSHSLAAITRIQTSVYLFTLCVCVCVDEANLDPAF